MAARTVLWGARQPPRLPGSHGPVRPYQVRPASRGRSSLAPLWHRLSAVPTARDAPGPARLTGRRRPSRLPLRRSPDGPGIPVLPARGYPV